MELTDEEKVVGEKAILEFEKRARNWSRDHARGLIL